MDNNVVSIFHHISLSYAAAFLGSIAALRNPLPAILFGILLVGLFILATRDRLFARHPELYYSSLFLLVTSLAVSGLRSNLGLASALASRYRINSAVLLILLYLYLAGKFHGIPVRPLLLKASACVAAVLLIGFTFASDLVGEKLLLSKRNAAEVEMLRWERHQPQRTGSVSFPGDFTAINEANGLFDPDDLILSESIREGIYKLPELPAEN